MISPLGIEGDRHAHPQIHGGPRQALLLIASEVIDELRTHGYPLFHGALGENLTTGGLDHRRWRGGQIWRVGSARIEFTKVRAPCATLDVYGRTIQQEIYDSRVKAGDPASPRWGMSGFYAAVLEPGTVRPGDPMILELESA